MTAVAFPTRSSTRPDAAPSSAVRAMALVVAACIIFGAGVVAATRLAGSVAQPTQSQLPSITAAFR
jgi:hypothetical protein